MTKQPPKIATGPDSTEGTIVTVTFDHRIPEGPAQLLRRFAQERKWWTFSGPQIKKFMENLGAKISFKGTNLIPAGEIWIRLDAAESDTFEWCDTTTPKGAHDPSLSELQKFFMTDLNSFAGPGVQWNDRHYNAKKFPHKASVAG